MAGTLAAAIQNGTLPDQRGDLTLARVAQDVRTGFGESGDRVIGQVVKLRG
jgi:hypothetical protein